MNDLQTKEWTTTLWVWRSEQRLEQVKRIKNRDDLSDHERTQEILDVVDTSMDSDLAGLSGSSGGSSPPMASMMRTEHLMDDGGLALNKFTRNGLNESTGQAEDVAETVDPLALKASMARIKGRLFELM